MRITVFMVILTIGITELFEVIKSLLIYTNIINNVVRIKNPTLLLLPKEDRAILLSNANAFKVRSDIEKERGMG